MNDQGFITAHHTRMYDHAFGTLFLAEVFGQTNRGDVRAKLQQAVDLIVSSQNAKGSWRYEPFALESDMSITVCQLMALRAARNVGIKVSKDTIKSAVQYVRDSQVHGETPPWMQGPDDYYMMGNGAFKYQYQEEGDMSRSSFALTAAGITSLYHAAEYDTKTLKDSLAFLEESMERVSRPPWRCHFFYWYGHYYAVRRCFSPATRTAAIRTGSATGSTSPASCSSRAATTARRRTARGPIRTGPGRTSRRPSR